MCERTRQQAAFGTRSKCQISDSGCCKATGCGATWRNSSSAAIESITSGGGDESVQGLLLGRERAGGGIRAGDVTRVPAYFGAGVNQDELPVREDARCRHEVEHGSVRSAGDDRLERQRIAAVAEEGG